LGKLSNVLVVEDNEQNRELVEYLLSEEGIQVLSAADAASALELARGGSVDMILLDMQIPGSDQADLVAELRASTPGKHVLILALTAHAMRGDRERFLTAGCDEYIAKPIRTATFVDELRRLFAAAEAHGGLG
jgi:two-component system cell cycle response regulator DivK